MHVKGAVAGNVQLPIVVVPSRKLTVPAGEPAPGETTATVAVRVTDCPKTDGLTDDARVVLVLALLTTCETAVLVLVAKFASPTYVAVTEWVATDRVVVLKVHVNGAAAGRVQLPTTVAPSRMLTVPVGEPTPGAFTVTVAVKVTDWPNTDGFAEEARAVLVRALLTV